MKTIGLWIYLFVIFLAGSIAADFGGFMLLQYICGIGCAMGVGMRIGELKAKDEEETNESF